VVLHQKGSHGPSYFERYPPAFRRFTPTCESNELGDCSTAEIVNTYDNTILYTDHALGRVLDVLQAHAAGIDAAMLYVSDHGESTGEHGFYLHGAPGFMAPAEQRRVPMFLWMSDGFAEQSRTDRACLAARRDTELSHDNLFHSVLGLLDVEAAAYRRDLDFVAACRDGAGGVHLAKAANAR
jgi:lipid A ethanolaminephosphotransferase